MLYLQATFVQLLLYSPFLFYNREVRKPRLYITFIRAVVTGGASVLRNFLPQGERDVPIQEHLF